MFDDAHAKARELTLEKGYVFVHPFDDDKVIAGAGTVGLEMLEDAPDLDTIVVPIGGGGLMSGVAIAARALKPDIELIGVEAELYPSMKCAIEGCHMPLGGDTLAEGIAVKQPGELTSRILKELATEVVLVSERDLERAVAMLVGIEKTVVEGAGAAGLAAMLANPERFKGKKVATILCGGNIDTHLLANVLVRDLVRAGPHRPPSRRRPRPAGRARRDHPQGLRSGRQRHRDQPQPDLHPAAGQGHHDRGRMRGSRRRLDRRRGDATRSRRLPRRARLARLIFPRFVENSCPRPGHPRP